MLDISSFDFCGQMRRSENVINQCYNLQINANMDRSGTFAASNFEVEIEKLALINHEKVSSVKAQQTEMSKRCAWGENAGLRWYKR